MYRSTVQLGAADIVRFLFRPGGLIADDYPSARYRRMRHLLADGKTLVGAVRKALG